MPSISARAAAEMLKKPAYEQSKILAGQKYPKEGSSPFRAPYYNPAIAGIRKFYKSGRKPQALIEAKAKIEGLSQESKRINNYRVLRQFLESKFSSRWLEIVSCEKFKAAIGDVEIRFHPEIKALEDEVDTYIYLHCTKDPIDLEIARLSLEISHWILEQNGVKVSMSQLKLVDMASKSEISFSRRRKTTIDLLTHNSKIIDAIWQSI